MWRSIASASLAFQSTRPARGATAMAKMEGWYGKFQSTRPARGATMATYDSDRGLWFQSTRPARGATHDGGRLRRGVRVSIHAPRAGRDFGRSVGHLRQRCFNPRAPRGARQDAVCNGTGWACFNPRAPRGARRKTASFPSAAESFQSTRPARGATQRSARFLASTRGFNPRAPRGARPASRRSIRRPGAFQSTRPARGATTSRSMPPQIAQVSIHAPRAGRDTPPRRGTGAMQGFNPRAPRGARPTSIADRETHALFQSTRPARGATRGPVQRAGGQRVSIHAPRAGRDSSGLCCTSC